MAANDLKVLLGAAIKAQRAALGISQEELAYRASLHRTYVSDVERSARNLSLESVEKLARALELSVPMLFQRASSRQRNEAAGRDSLRQSAQRASSASAGKKIVKDR